MKLFLSISVVLLSFLSFQSMAQEKPLNTAAQNSVRPIDDANVHFKVRLWRRLDLNEKINQPLFSYNNEISKFLVEWVEAGILTAYTNDSLTTKLTTAQFKENLKIEEGVVDGELSEAEKSAGFGGESKTTATAGTDDGWGGKTTAATDKTKTADNSFAEKPSSTTAAYYFPKELTIIEIKEDAIIDRQRSRMYFDIQSFTLIIPAAKTKAGFDKPIASFRYKDVYKLFRNTPNCIWYNSQNEIQHKNMADAFDLRMFQARIVKKGNSRNQYLTDINNSEVDGLNRSQLLEYELLEMEHDMWEN
ncbi:gliding motility protein GldN [Aquirufa sp. ROCK2-A2]